MIKTEMWWKGFVTRTGNRSGNGNTLPQFRKNDVSISLMKFYHVYILLLILVFSCENKDPGRTYENIEGAYRCEENHPVSGIRTYLVEIDRVKNETDLYLISNFYDAGYNEFLFARLSGKELMITDQIITGLIVNGTGQVRDDFKWIDWEYEVGDGITTQNMVARYTRD